MRVSSFWTALEFGWEGGAKRELHAAFLHPLLASPARGQGVKTWIYNACSMCVRERIRAHLPRKVIPIQVGHEFKAEELV